jgi:hypothetical protein
LATTTVETSVASDPDIGHTAITHREAFDVFSHFDDDTYCFVTCNELETVIALAHISINQRHTGNLEMNSPSWMWPSVPQTPQQDTIALDERVLGER